MFRRCPAHRARGDTVVKGSQCAAVVDSQRQQVGIGDLVVPHDAGPVQYRRVAQADIARPKRVIHIAARQRQFFPYGFKARWCAVGITRQVQYPKNAVLR